MVQKTTRNTTQQDSTEKKSDQENAKSSNWISAIFDFFANIYEIVANFRFLIWLGDLILRFFRAIWAFLRSMFE